MTWIYAYFLGYFAFAAWWITDDVRDRRSPWFIATELAGDICLVLVGLAYWFPPVRPLLGTVAIPVFSAGLAWFILSGVVDFKRHFPDPELPLHLNVAAALSGFALAFIICGPLIYWGFSYAVLGRIAST